MAKYITTDDFDAIVDARVRQSLFDDGSGYTPALFDAAVTYSSVMAKAAAENAGYDTGVDDSSTNDMVKMATIAVLVYLAYGRKSRTVPEATALICAPLLEAIRAGDMPIPGMTISNTAEAVGGSDFSDPDSATTGVRSSGTGPRFRDLGRIL